ncbi:MAG: MFS transporter [Geminicoccaceae bacterium]
MTLPTHWRDLLALMSASTVAGMTLSFVIPLLSLVMEQAGHPDWLIGLNAATAGLSAFIIAPLLPRLVPVFGLRTLMISGMLLSAVMIMAFPQTDHIGLWFVIRFFAGVGMVVPFVLGEAAINALADEDSRGRIMGVYGTLFCVGFAFGPALISLLGTETSLPFYTAAGLLVIASTPILLAKKADIGFERPSDLSFAAVYALAPLAFVSIMVFGVMETAAFVLLPLYGLWLGLDSGGAAFLLSALIAGNIVLQYPLGWLGDRFGRPKLLLICLAAGALCAFIMPLTTHALWLVLLMLVAFGGALGGMYTLTLSVIGMRFRGGDLAKASALFVLSYEAGAIFGPAALGTATSLTGMGALPVWLGGLLIVALIVGFRIEAQPALPIAAALKRGSP